jgi:WD40 repeat protein
VWSSWARGKAAVLDVASGAVRVFLEGDGRISNLAISPSGMMLAAEIEDGTGTRVGLWDVASGKKIRSIYELPKAPPGSLTRAWISGLIFGPDSRKVAFALLRQQKYGGAAHYEVGHGDYGFSFGQDDGDLVLVFDALTGKQLVEIKAQALTQTAALPFTPQITDLVFTPDGDKLVFSTFGVTAGVWDIAAQKRLQSFRGHMPSEGKIALSPDGKTLALATYDSTVRLWSVNTGQELFPEDPGHRSHIRSLAYSSDGNSLVTAGGGTIFYHNFDARTPDSRFDYGQVLVWDLATRRPRGALPGVGALAFSPRGDHLAVTAKHTSAVRIFSMAKGMEAHNVAAARGRTFVSAFFSADGGELFTLDSASWRDPGMDPKGGIVPPLRGRPAEQYCLRHWNLTTGKQEKESTIASEAYAHEIALAPDGKTVVALHDGDVTIHDLESGQQRLLRAPDKYAERPLSFSPDGRMIASGVAQRRPADESGYAASPAPANVKFWEIATGKEIFHLKRHRGSSAEIAWSPDGKLVATWGLADVPLDWATPPSVRIWDTATGKELARFGGIDGYVTVLGFAPDGRSLAAGLRDGTVLIFDVAKAPGQVRPPDLADGAFESYWSDLGADDAAKAHRAIGALVAVPKRSVGFLQGKLKVAIRADAANIRKWLSDLDSGRFAVRQAAVKELEKVGDQVKAPIQKALSGKTTLEMRRRLEQLLTKLCEAPSGDTVRAVRAITALERIGSPEARRALEDLARGAPGARETEEAIVSLQRLGCRAAR